MLLYKRILAGDQERVLLISNGRLQRILVSGEYRVWTLGRSVEIERHNVYDLEFNSQWADYIFTYRPDLVEQFFAAVETRDTEVALVYLDGKLARVVGPGRRVLYWADSAQVTSRVFDANIEPEVPRDAVPALARLLEAPEGANSIPVICCSIEEGKAGLLYVDGRFVRTVGPGASAFWTAAGKPRVDVVDMRVQTVEVPSQDISTKDNVPLRVSLTATFQVIDPVLAKTRVNDYAEYLYRALELATRHALGKWTLEEVLAEKSDVVASVAAEAASRMMAYGVRVSAVAMKDIVLPRALHVTAAGVR